MRPFLAISLLALAACGAFGAFGGCAERRDAPARDQPAPALATVSVEQLDQLLATHAWRAVDANGDVTRRKMGIIPGAVLLRDFESLANLPADKTQGLVFYCANTWCEASHQAAASALAAGYTQVKVLPEGIAGWVKAGKPTASVN